MATPTRRPTNRSRTQTRSRASGGSRGGSRPSAARRPTALEVKAKEKANAAATRTGVGALRWIGFTLGGDTIRARIGVPHMLLNWAAIAAWVAAAWWVAPLHHTPGLWVLIGAALAGIVYTVGRAQRHLGARDAALQKIYDATEARCKHPRSTATRPVDPADRVTVRRWSRTRGVPLKGRVAYSATSDASTMLGRGKTERDFEDQVQAPPGQEWAFDWSSPGVMGFELIADTDPRVEQRPLRYRIEESASSLFGRGVPDGLKVAVTWDADEPKLPASIAITYGYAVSLNAQMRADAERTFDDKMVGLPREWVYDWDTQKGTLLIDVVPLDDPGAQRKRSNRKVSDVAVKALKEAVREAGPQANVYVTEWMPEDAKQAPNTPLQIVAEFGTADFSKVDKRHEVEDHVDMALANEWPDRAWLHKWSHGYDGRLLLVAVPLGSEEAERKDELARTRKIITGGFPKAPGLEVDVLDWRTTSEGEQRIARMLVRYGTANMAKRDEQIKVEEYLDSQTNGNDWRYEWNRPGQLLVTSVPSLPDRVWFPLPHTPEWDEWHRKFRAGVFEFGPARGGFRAEINWGLSPHALGGGSTGAGKSQWGGLEVYGILMNPDVCSAVIVDPKLTDWTWVGGYPNVVGFAPTDATRMYEQIADAVKLAYAEMMKRQLLLQRHGYRKLEELRAAIRAGKVPDLSLDEVPGRFYLFFDEVAAAFERVKGDDEAKDYQEEALRLLAVIGMLGRSMEVHMTTLAQKPSDKNIGTAVRAHLVNQVGIGHLDQYTSAQVMGSNICDARLPKGAPKGRGWFVNDTGQELLFQCYYLPNHSEPCPWDPEVQLVGIQEQVAERLTSMGYTPIEKMVQLVRPKDLFDPNNADVEVIDVTRIEWVRVDPYNPDSQSTMDARFQGMTSELTFDASEGAGEVGDGLVSSAAGVVPPPPPPVVSVSGAPRGDDAAVDTDDTDDEGWGDEDGVETVAVSRAARLGDVTPPPPPPPPPAG